jgi:hypothetical protein
MIMLLSSMNLCFLNVSILLAVSLPIRNAPFPCSCPRLQAVSLIIWLALVPASMRVSAAICRALLALWTSGGAAVMPLAKQLVERHVDTLSQLVALGTGANASTRIVRETAARAALLMSRALPPSFEIVVAANARASVGRRRRSKSRNRHVRLHDAVMPLRTMTSTTIIKPTTRRVSRLSRPSSTTTSIRRAPPVARRRASAMDAWQWRGSSGGLRLAIVRAGVGVRLARLALSNDPLCRSAALESLATVSRGCGDRRALRSLATVSDASSSLVSR